MISILIYFYFKNIYMLYTYTLLDIEVSCDVRMSVDSLGFNICIGTISEKYSSFIYLVFNNSFHIKSNNLWYFCMAEIPAIPFICELQFEVVKINSFKKLIGKLLCSNRNLCLDKNTIIWSSVIPNSFIFYYFLGLSFGMFAFFYCKTISHLSISSYWK